MEKCMTILTLAPYSVREAYAQVFKDRMIENEFVESAAGAMKYIATKGIFEGFILDHRLPDKLIDPALRVPLIQQGKIPVLHIRETERERITSGKAISITFHFRSEFPRTRQQFRYLDTVDLETAIRSWYVPQSLCA